MTDSAPFRQVGALRYWRFDHDHPHFTDAPLLTRDQDGKVVAIRGDLPTLVPGMAELIEPGITYGYLTNPTLDLVELVAAGEEFIDPREAWLHTFGDEAFDTGTLPGYRDGVAALLRTLDRALAAGWGIIATVDDGLVLGPRS